MQTARYKIRFINGDLEGRSFAVKESGVVIGSSMNADIRSSDAGVAEEHVTLLPQSGGGIVMHCSADALVRNGQASAGTDAALRPGDDVKLGKSLAFVVEEYGALAHSEEPDIDIYGEATVNPASGGLNADSGGEDVSHTRYASAEELADLRAANKSMERQRRLAVVVGIFISIAILGLAYYISESGVENPVTSPGEVTGVYDDGEQRIDLGDNGKFLIYYPNSPAMVKNAKGSNFEVLTAVGRKQDVPFHITFEATPVKDGYAKTPRKSFDEWLAAAEKNSGMKFTSEPQGDFFNKRDNGYPYIRINYTRKAGPMVWRGVACYARFLDKQIVLMREVPETQYWRASSLLKDYDCMSVANSTVARYWEVPENPLRENTTKMLQMLNRELRKNIEIASWEDIDLLISSLFVEAYKNNERPLIDATQSLLEKFRAAQKVWYSRKCLEYSDSLRDGKKDETTRILNDCLEKFEPLNDYRYTRIMKNDWSVE